jgi:TonB family protein
LFTVNQPICATVLSVVLTVLSMAQDTPPVVILKDSILCHGKRSDTVGCITRPQPTHTPQPNYPESERMARHEGMVTLTLVVGSDGAPRDVAVSGALSPDLDQAAVDAVKRWRFKPAIKDGKPIPVKMEVELAFHLTH